MPQPGMMEGRKMCVEPGRRKEGRLTGRKRSCSLYSPTSCSVIGAGGGASGGVDSLEAPSSG